MIIYKLYYRLYIVIHNYKASQSESSLNIRKDIVIVIVMVTLSHTLNNVYF